MLDEFFYALANEHRRQLLLALLEHNPQEDIPALYVAGGETAQDHLKTELVHMHLPLLEECGLIAWDHETHHLTRGPQFEKIRPVLEALPEVMDR